ncbi:MAG: hypothetical protein EON59_11260 [Alphaproteobacteria bacterium]|nr:MAG: hypothetical protein EON59_11260 [Alphaproteobacteria bacterium]
MSDSLSKGPDVSLAEGRWLWRRVYVFATSGAAWIVLDRLIVAMPAPAAAVLAQSLMGLLALTLVIYLVAPTAQQLIAGLAMLRDQRGADR